MNIPQKELDYFEQCLSHIKKYPMYTRGYIYMPAYGEEDNISRVHTIEGWINKINSMNRKIELSFREAIEWAKKMDFSISSLLKMQKDYEEEMCDYYIENAVFRLITLWDLLAQLSNIYYETGLESSNIGYKKYFIGRMGNDRTRLKQDMGGDKDFNKFAKTVKAYIREEDDINLEGAWKGNHTYISDIVRNPLTHKHDPHSFSVIEGDMHLSEIPIISIKRGLEDLIKVNEFIRIVIDKIETKLTLEKLDI